MRVALDSAAMRRTIARGADWVGMDAHARRSARATVARTLETLRIAGWRREPLDTAGVRLLHVAAGGRPRRALRFVNAPGLDSGVQTDEGGHREVNRISGRVELEPWSGHVIRNGRLVEGSFDGYLRRIPDPVAFRLRRRRVVRRALSLHHAFPDNYCHFLTIIAPRLVLADAAGVPRDIPAVVPEALARQRFFREAVDLGLLGGRDFIVQSADEIIRGEDYYVVLDSDPLSGVRAVAERLRPGTAIGGRRRIFVDRGPAARNGRRIANRIEVLAVVRDFGCDVVDAGTLSLSEQIDLFAGADVLVAPHGAGVSNMAFMASRPARIVELFSPRHKIAWFVDLAQVLGHQHTAVLGRAAGPLANSDFEVEPKVLAAVLGEVLRSRDDAPARH